MASVARSEHPSKGKTFEINHGGDLKPFEDDPNETIEQVIVLAIKRFQLAAQPHQLGLFKPGEPNPLDPTTTLGAAGVHSGDELTLKPIVVQGG